jgi:hypothetical protein
MGSRGQLPGVGGAFSRHASDRPTGSVMSDSSQFFACQRTPWGLFDAFMESMNAFSGLDSHSTIVKASGHAANP